ncbi:reverse transcriptase domain-containing protein [Thauera aromatica]|uniref:reverse transcriptase domain-containing protein n=1 Tax=Thauera aromatica TaxID=59405 RepID=UPI001FFDA2B3|nr:reverse transcriptase domain-containing protein [Thauera aromatica]MCK2095650.1 reverse transcriptase domain-containing protein [Thauera aromatica]
MPKRHGNLFSRCFTPDTLMAAYLRARRGKRKTLSVAKFEANLGANLQALHDELHEGTYRPLPYRHFMVMEPKPRQISAPAFRDVVVQHAIYALICPIFDAGFIHDSYGCRAGKGTHRASDRAQQFLRQSPDDAVTLQMDVRKFYYSIDRAILRTLIERKIKDARFVDLMMTFADHGGAVGVPIGNLLSQLYALIYLDPLDHFVKRELRVGRYVRYVDDFILWCTGREQAAGLRHDIEAFLFERLGLTLSRWTIAPIGRGMNFVGFRTWRKRRFVRKHSLYRFSRSLRAGDTASLNAILGNARRTASHAHLCRRVRQERPDLIPHLAL